MNNVSTIPTPATPDVCTFSVLVEGKEISGEFHVLFLSVTRELNRIPAAIFELQDGEPAKSTFAASDTANFVPGKHIEIQLGYRSQNQTVFKGLIVKHSLKVRKGGNMLIVECRDEAIKMTAVRKSRYFTGKKDSDIMEDLLGLHALQKDVEQTVPALKEVVQYDATDWDFMLCRAEANGQVVFVEDAKVKVAKPVVTGTPVVQIAYGSTVLELDVEMDARWQSKGIKATSWNASDQAIVNADAREPQVTGNGNISPADLAKALGADTQEVRHGGKIDTAELQAWADARLLKERLAKTRGRAKFQGFAGVVPGNIVSITGIGERFEGKMYVSGVRHSLSAGNWETDVQFGLSTDLFAETYNLRPLPAAGLLPAVSGLQIGVVTALENDPDGEYRIQVRLPMVSTTEEGIWARIATLDAGKGRGTYFRPEIHDEVIIGFLNEDPRFPVVLGMCHSSAKPAPEPAKDTNHHKGYVSREKMKLTFDDEKKIIAMETPGGNKLALSEDAKGIILQDQNGNKITLDDKGITIESAKDLVLKAGKDFKLSGVNAELKAQSSFKASGSGTAELSGASTTVKGSTTTVIQGGMVHIN